MCTLKSAAANCSLRAAALHSDWQRSFRHLREVLNDKLKTSAAGPASRRVCRISRRSFKLIFLHFIYFFAHSRVCRGTWDRTAWNFAYILVWSEQQWHKRHDSGRKMQHDRWETCNQRTSRHTQKEEKASVGLNFIWLRFIWIWNNIHHCWLQIQEMKIWLQATVTAHAAHQASFDLDCHGMQLCNPPTLTLFLHVFF